MRFILVRVVPPMVRGINIVDARTSPCAIEDDANAVGLNLVEAKDALSFGALSHTAASSSHPYDRASCRWSPSAHLPPA